VNRSCSGGSAGIGLETGRRARAEGADVILTGRNPERLQNAARDLGALNTTTFDANASYTEKEQENERDQAVHR
jgi:short-subunit dehydrogenase involved in D-alanine esterification of teichoic acids